jgi:hypothetical protein
VLQVLLTAVAGVAALTALSCYLRNTCLLSAFLGSVGHKLQLVNPWGLAGLIF